MMESESLINLCVTANVHILHWGWRAGRTGGLGWRLFLLCIFSVASSYDPSFFIQFLFDHLYDHERFNWHTSSHIHHNRASTHSHVGAIYSTCFFPSFLGGGRGWGGHLKIFCLLYIPFRDTFFSWDVPLAWRCTFCEHGYFSGIFSWEGNHHIRFSGD